MYDEPLKKIRIDTVRRSESRKVETHTRDLSYTVGASANRLATDNVATDNSKRKWRPVRRVGIRPARTVESRPWDVIRTLVVIVRNSC